MTGDGYSHMFVKCLIQYTSGLGGMYYVSVVLRYHIYLQLHPDVLGSVVDHRRTGLLSPLYSTPRM